MRRLIFIVWGMSLLLVNYSCGENLTRKVTVRNDIDTTLVFMSTNDVTRIYDNSPNPSRCFTSQMHKIRQDESILCTVELNFDTKDIYVYVYKDLSGEDNDLNMIKDCEKIKLKNLNGMTYTLQELESMGYTIVLDSLTLGLKSPE